MTPRSSNPDDYLRRLLAENGGSVSVERFMQEALYHPEVGYYARTVRTVGARGDFSTSATLHPALGEAIAGWLRAHAAASSPGEGSASHLAAAASGGTAARRGAETPRSAKCGQRFPLLAVSLRHCVRFMRTAFASAGQWHVIELGAGTGELAESVLAALGCLGRGGLRYHVVEVSAGLRAAQQARLGRRVEWHGDIRSALHAADGNALIFSNEFVDAFPCAQLAWSAAENRWREVRVRWTPAGPESFVALSPLPVSHAPPGGADGQRIERHERYRRWLAEWAPHWRAGRMLTIDYGDEWPRLSHRRPAGTLRAYWKHQRLAGNEVFARFGRQDLPAAVNFSALQQWGTDAGLAHDPPASQAAFLRRWLPPRTLRRTDPALRFLLDPDGAGGAFKTLEQWPAPSDSAGAKGDPGVHFPTL